MDTGVNRVDHVLVCGLGSLGQQCVAVLKTFGMQISAIDLAQPISWEVENLPELLETLVIGDCRRSNVLQQANIQRCRAVLLVTNNERLNIETAFAVRLLNPQVRLVVRSAEQQLNQLLDQQLGNFAAFEVTGLSARALTIAALANETQGLITLSNQLLRVTRCVIDPDHRWCNLRLVHELNNRTRRVLSHDPAAAMPSTQFYQWEPNARIQAGDRITYIEITQGLVDLVQPQIRSTAAQRQKTLGQRWANLLQHLKNVNLRHLKSQFWQFAAQQQTKRVAILIGLMVVSLIVLGTTIPKAAHPEQIWLKALYVRSVMLLGSYDVVFGALSSSDSTPVWMRFLNLSYMLAGTASIVVLYALLTESLLAAKFALPNKRPPLPQQDHVILIGLGRVGRQIATYLQKLRQPLVGVSNLALESSQLPEMHLLVSDFREALADVNLPHAKSVVVATDNEMANLEIGLIAHAINPDTALVIQTFEPEFSGNIDRLLPYADVLCSYSLAAEAFTAAIFGDHILDLLRLNDQTVLVAEYDIQSEDGLHDLLIAELAQGYGVVPILHQDRSEVPTLMPSDDINLKVGDRIVVLAMVDSLQHINQRNILLPDWQVSITSTAIRSAVFESVRTIVLITGYSLSVATEVMNQLPAVVPTPLYKHQALRLVRELSKIQTQAHLIPYSPKL